SGLLGIRGIEAELPPGLELPRISTPPRDVGHPGRALPRVGPGLRMGMGGKGRPASRIARRPHRKALLPPAGEGPSVPAGGETPEVCCRAGYPAGFSTTRVLTATSSGIVPVSAQSPPPTPKSRRLTVALPASTGAAPGVQVKVSVTGLLTPRSSSVPSAA